VVTRDSDQRAATTDLPRNCTFDAGDFAIVARYWYPIARSCEVSTAPLSATLLDEPLVVYRAGARWTSDEVRHAVASHDKVRRVFGGGGQLVPLSEGLARMSAWARRHGPVEPSVFSAIEIERNLPPSWRAVLAAGVPR